MSEYAIALSLSFRELQHYISINFQTLLPGLLAAAIVLVAVGLFKPPKV